MSADTLPLTKSDEFSEPGVCESLSEVVDTPQVNTENNLNDATHSQSDECPCVNNDHNEEAPEVNNVCDTEIKSDCEKLPEIKETTELPSLQVQGSCSICITFQSEAIADTYKAKFLKFINSFPELQVQNCSSLNIEIIKDENAVCNENAETSDESPSSKRRRKHSKAKKELFTLDVTPSENKQQKQLRYTSKFTINNLSEEETGEYARIPSKGSCFNCDERHSLKDCPYPKDYTKINAARQKFNKVVFSRYHLENNKYGNLKPGAISQELRKALGLKNPEIPHYIYLMRKFGYPPGWLEEAKLAHSELNLIDIDGNQVKGATITKVGLDPKKIVDYPGFNVPPEKDFRDDCRLYRVAPYSDNFSKSAMITFFNKKFAKERDNLETCDMDLDNADVNSENPQEKVKEDRISPSLVDLEEQKKQLLEELNSEPKREIADNGYKSESGFLAVKTSCFGTPLIKSASPYSTLPNPDNFSKDVSPVINFENLPNSTGKYEQMTDVLQKVRHMKKTQNT